MLLTLYSIVIGLSGSALVFKQEIEEQLYPQLFHVQQRPAEISLDTAIRRIAADRPGWRVTGLRDFSNPGNAVTLLMAPDGAPRDSNYRAVAFDRADGRVLADGMRFDGVLGWLANLHFNLLSGHTGMLLSGAMAAGLLLLCVTGLILWWRGVQRWFEFLWLRVHRLHSRGVNWRRLNWDLHSVVGFWSSALLLAVTVTGIYFCYPDVVRPAVLFATDSHPAAAALQKPPSSPANRSPLSLDAVLQAAARALPADAPADYLFIPAKPGMPFSATGYYRGAAPYSKLVRITLDGRTGETLSYEDTTKLTRGDRLVQLFFAVHFGSFAEGTVFNLPVKLLWVFTGLVPALLAATGCILYWNRTIHPRLRKRAREWQARPQPLVG